MIPTSLAIRTDLIFHRFQGWVVDRGDYLFVETPSNPTFHWGNALYFGLPPRKGDRLRWMRLWRKEFSHNPGVRHVSFAWEGGRGDAGEIGEFVESGFDLQQNIVLIAERVRPGHAAKKTIEVRAIETDSEWSEALAVQIDGRGEEYERSAYADFKAKQMGSYREMVHKGMGHWFGAFVGGEQAGNLGLFFDGDVARYQSVVTHPKYRRLGVCSALVYETAKQALDTKRAKQLVMVADELGIARSIYESVGFREAEPSWSLSWWPRG